MQMCFPTHYHPNVTSYALQKSTSESQGTRMTQAAVAGRELLEVDNFSSMTKDSHKELFASNILNIHILLK